MQVINITKCKREQFKGKEKLEKLTYCCVVEYEAPVTSPKKIHGRW